jgi:PKD domain
VRSFWWSLAIAVVLVGALGPLGGLAPVRAAPALPAAAVPATPAGFGANASAVVAGGTWNCGQGSETIDLFGRAISGAGPFQYQWSFGDGSAPSAAQDPVHTYYNVQTATANLTVTDGANATAHAQVSAVWTIPLNCSSTPTTDRAGIALYLVLVVGVAGAIVLLVRRRRQPPPT